MGLPGTLPAIITSSDAHIMDSPRLVLIHCSSHMRMNLVTVLARFWAEGIAPPLFVSKLAVTIPASEKGWWSGAFARSRCSLHRRDRG